MNLFESPALLSINTPITWYSETAQRHCECRLRIYKVTFDKAIVIVSEVQDNSGRSISEEVFTLIPRVCNEFALNPGKTMWVEHYPVGYLMEEETYNEVMLVMGYTSSKRIEKQKLEALLGVKL